MYLNMLLESAQLCTAGKLESESGLCFLLKYLRNSKTINMTSQEFRMARDNVMCRRVGLPSPCASRLRDKGNVRAAVLSHTLVNII